MRKSFLYAISLLCLCKLGYVCLRFFEYNRGTFDAFRLIVGIFAVFGILIMLREFASRKARGLRILFVFAAIETFSNLAPSLANLNMFISIERRQGLAIPGRNAILLRELGIDCGFDLLFWAFVIGVFYLQLRGIERGAKSVEDMGDV